MTIENPQPMYDHERKFLATGKFRCAFAFAKRCNKMVQKLHFGGKTVYTNSFPCVLNYNDDPFSSSEDRKLSKKAPGVQWLKVSFDSFTDYG